MSHKIVRTLLLFAAVALAGGCAPKEPPLDPARLADPKTAALTFTQAIDRGDIATAKAASFGAEQESWVIATASMSGGLRAVASAIDARYGAKGGATSGGLRRAAHAISGEAVDAVQMADAQVQDDTATMSAKNSFTNGRLKQASVLRRDAKGLWRVDLPAVFKKYPILERERESSLLKNYLSAGKELQKIAKEIRDGKYPTVVDARNAISERMGQQ